MRKIGLDYHGVITVIPEILAPLTQKWCEAGNELHVITGHRITEEFKTTLRSLGIAFTHLFSISDFHHEIGTSMTGYEEGRPIIAEEIWNKTKALYCQEHSIDLHIDDSKEYGQYFTTPYFLFVPEDGSICFRLRRDK